MRDIKPDCVPITVISDTQNQLAWLTYHLDDSDGELEEEDVGAKDGKLVSTPSGARSNADTPNTTLKKVGGEI